MCGISGIINKNTKSVSKDEIKKMNDLIIHRGPDYEGYYFGKNLAFGHRRLAILDLSEAGHQPMKYKGKKGEYVIVYNGEIYNYIELRNELLKYGYEFKSNTDTEVILASYDKWGEECVNKFNGMWAFAIYDKKKNVIFCSRDRFGIKPFYYTEINNKFIFGSEIKQFTAVNGWKAVLNNRRAFDFLEYGLFDHTNETLFENVFQLRGGHNLIYDLKTYKYTIYNWYVPNFKNQKEFFSFNEDEIAERFKELLIDAIRLRLRSDVKIGSCLSGGLDSSTIVCVMNELITEEKYQIETVSSCFHIKKFDEQEFIDEVVYHTNVKSNKVFPQFSDLFKELGKIIWHQDEPFGSTSIFAQWNVFKEAKNNGLIVMLDGQGADELLAGYPSFYGVFLLELIKNMKFLTFIRELKKIKGLQNYSYSYILMLMFSNLLSGKLKYILRQIYTRKFNLFNKNFQSDKYKKSCCSITDLSYEQIKNLSLPMLLHYEDRNSMAFSIEARVPFLDYRLVEFVLTLPSEYKIKNGQTKYILREAMKDMIPEKIKNRYDKMGFVTPEEIWVKKNKEVFFYNLKEAIINSNGIINENVINYFYNVINGKVKFDSTIWRIVVFNKWLKTFNVRVNT